jgi:hypothetical protein
MLKTGVWFIGNVAWLIGIADRGTSTLADQHLSKVDFIQLFTIVCLFAFWLVLKPNHRVLK